MKSVAKTSIILLLTAVCVTSCDNRMVYDHFQHIENAEWHWDQPLNFSFTMDDTLSLFNVFIHLRHTTDYPLSNLYMFVQTEGPSGQSMTDTINFILAENSGKWVGSGITNIREIGFLFKKNIRFPEAGDYSVSIEQAMRLPEIPVSEVGVRVEKIH